MSSRHLFDCQDNMSRISSCPLLTTRTRVVSPRHPTIRVVEEWMLDVGEDQTVVAKKSKISYAAFNKALTRDGARLSLEVMQAIEKAYGLKLGTFLRRAGYVEDIALPEELICTDGRMTQRWRDSIVDVIQTAIAVSASEGKRS